MASSPQSKEHPVRGLSLEGVSVSFDGKPALVDVTLTVEPGERLAVIGASGAGKTTLFRVLTRGATLSGGRVVVGGRDLYALPRRKLKDVQSKVGTVRQAYDLVPQLPAGLNAALGEIGAMGSLSTLRTLAFGPKPALARRVTDALHRLGIGDYTGVRTVSLSGGQQQRVAVARLLVQRPDLILADEPFASVDPVTTERVLDTLLELNREGATLLVNLHDVRIARRFERVVALREGHIVFDGPPERLTEEALNTIYAGDDPYGTARAGASTEQEDEVRHRGEDPVRIVEGRDGIASH